MTLYQLVQSNKDNIAGRLNPAFYQILNGENNAWYYENFINLVSYNRDGQHIIDFTDNTSAMFESRIRTEHVFAIDEIEPQNFVVFLTECMQKELYVNIWCDEFYIPQSARYNRSHFVHPLTVYSFRNGRFCCEFFSIQHGMILIELQPDEVQQAFYSSQQFYTNGATPEVMETALSAYRVRRHSSEKFRWDRFIEELSDYLHGQFNEAKAQLTGSTEIGERNVTFGIHYYNDLLKLISRQETASLLPFKCLFDLHLHKAFLMERLRYIRENICNDPESLSSFDQYLSQWKNVVHTYERVNLLNMKYNMKDGYAPQTFSVNP